MVARCLTVLLATALLLQGGEDVDGIRLPTGLGSSGQPGWHVVTEYSLHDPTVPEGAYHKITGLFVGVGRYQSLQPTLPNPANDAREVSKTLEEICGLRKENYEVLTDERATLSGLNAALLALGTNSDAGDLFIFHFSGHGIALQNSATGERNGRLLLHEVQSTQGMIDGAGVVDMEQLQQMVAQAGIRAKHQLYLLDCCYSGMGAVAGTRSAQVRQMPSEKVMEENLKHRAAYVITAGGRDEPVLDGPNTGSAGHGVLTGEFIRCLRNPVESGLGHGVVTFQGRKYLYVRDLFGVIENSVPLSAAELIRTASKGTQENSSRVLSRNATTPILAPNASGTLKAQRPQEIRKNGEGRVYLPLQELPVSAAGQASNVTRYEDWAEKVAAKYARPEYGLALKKVFALLLNGKPGGDNRADTLEFEAELMSRPKAQPQTQNPENPSESALELAFKLETARKRTPGADWQILPREGSIISRHFEYRIHLRNRGAAPLYYYLIAIDQAGIFQWLAPENTSWKSVQDGVPIAYGSSPLSVGGENSKLNLPDDQPTPFGVVTRGWPVVNTVDQQFVLVAVSSGWPELANALHAASAIADDIHASMQAETPLAIRLPGQLTRSRQLGQPPALLLRVDTNRPSDAVSPPVVTRVDGGLMVTAWNIHVVENNQWIPILQQLNPPPKP